VPTQFHAKIFAENGVQPEKLVVIPEAVDTDFFNPHRIRSLIEASAPSSSSVSSPIFQYPDESGIMTRLADKDRETTITGIPANEAAGNSQDFSSSISNNKKQLFRFLSVFKWEERKGWRFLLEAFFREFSADDAVVLYILTNTYHPDPSSPSIESIIDTMKHEVRGKMSKEAEEQEQGEVDGKGRTLVSDDDFASVRLLPRGIPDTQMPSVYYGADAFVLPSRGEGWGRPHVEAMAMELPVIATHWSGPEQYMTENNSYPLSIEGLELVGSGAFREHMWAKPSVKHLQQLMREVFTSREEAREKGRQARRDMLSYYCPVCVAQQVMQELASYRKE